MVAREWVSVGRTHVQERGAICGQLEVLQWARAQTAVPGTSMYAGNATFCRSPRDAALGARENGCPWDERICARAAYGGHFEVLQWARSERLPVERSHVQSGRERRAPRGAEMGARERMPLELAPLCVGGAGE